MEEALSPRRFRFTLRQLGVLVVFLGMGIALVMQYRELASLRPEVRKLRDEAGYLTVEDPKKLYAIGVEKYEKLTWSWKVHIPAEGRYVLYTKLNGVPVDPTERVAAIPVVVDGSMSFENGGHAIVLTPGELTVTIALRPQKNGKVDLHLTAGKLVLESSIPVESTSWPQVQNLSSTTRVATKSHEQSPSEPLVLLLVRASDSCGKLSLGGTPGKTADGIKVWIEQVAK